MNSTIIKSNDTDIKMVNAIMLDESEVIISYESDISLLKSIRYYNKIKKIFGNQIDYSYLENHLIQEIRRR